MIQTSIKQVQGKTGLPLEFFVTKVSNHTQAKKAILEAIEQQGCYGFKNDAQQISNTDWHLSPTFNRPYMNIAGSILAGHLELLKTNYGYDSVSLKNYWFQQYKKGDYHSEHTHPSCSFSSIYYVDFGKDSPRTNFIYKGKTFSFEVEEGNIISFPSFLIHFSPENQSKHVKTVISFNADAARETSKIHSSYKGN